MEEVKKFLLLNGFITVTENDVYLKSGEDQDAFIRIHDNCYAIQFNGGVMYSVDLNIYWLIGVLTYYNIIDKNYKIK